MSKNATERAWCLRGRGYEFCNCAPGCTCNFTGEPNSVDGSCKTAIAFRVSEGFCGEVDMAGLEVAFIVDWPGAIHEGGGRAVLCFRPTTSDEQLEGFTGILAGRHGGMPWSIASTTFDVVAVIRAELEIVDDGMSSSFSIGGIGEAHGTSLRHPSTGNENLVSIVFPRGGFIFDRADCGKGDFNIDVEGLHFDYTDTNWLKFEFDWANN